MKTKSNPTLADVRQAVDRTFAPDVSLTWCQTLNAWAPSTIRNWAIVRQLNGGSHSVTDIDAFMAACASHGLCIETIGEPSP